jgi:outer membrane PBP1 activator LpoA protein
VIQLMTRLTRLSPVAGRALLLAASLVLAACASLERAPVPSVDRAEALARAGDPAGAARVYEALAADNAEPVRSTYLLRAASAWTRAGLYDPAEQALGALATELPPAETLERGLLEAELALDRGQGAAAYDLLANAHEPAAAPAAIRYLALRERAAFASGRPAEGVRAELAREHWLPTPVARLDSRSALLRELRAAGARGLKLEANSSRDPVVRGWLEVGSIVASATDNPAAATPALKAWAVRYPAHPAGEVIRTQFVAPIIGPGAAPLAPLAPIAAVAPAGPPAREIALLLPLSGPLAAAASSVREGFESACSRPEPQRPEVRVYDTAALSVSAALAAATADGAEFIAGPLTREELILAADYQGPRPPMLALNFLPADHPAPANFYQFALSPEDEARQVARKLLADGARRGLVLAPAGDWGERVLNAFTEELRAGGGTVLARAELDPAKADYSAPITELLRITESKARHKRLETLLGTTLAFEPRRRADVDFIFAASQPAMARLLRPQLRFHYAGDIPTYSTSDAYEPNPTANQDIDGLLFPEMPWMLDNGPLAQSVRDEAKDGPPGGPPRRGRLFAFGFDACNLVTALRAGGAVQIDGLTGTLTLGADRHVRRELAWARIKDGEAQFTAAAN